jgi:prolyl-tRNA synthetase
VRCGFPPHRGRPSTRRSSDGCKAWAGRRGWLEAESLFSGARARAVVIEGQSGEARLLVCPNCGYGAEAGIAVFRRDILQREPTSVEEVATPGATTIASLATQLGIAASEAGKIVVLASGDPPAGPPRRIVMAIVPGDMGVSETKLRLATGLASFRPASDEELRAHGVVPGYGSPVGARDLLVVVDEAVELSSGLVMGANREGYHRRGMVCGRDYRPDLVADIAAAAPGHGCLQCGSALKATRGICIARGGAIQTSHGATVGLSFATADGETRPLRMEWIEIRAGRMLEAAAEEWGADSGLFLPRWFSVCEVHLIVLDGGEEAAERLIEELAAAGIEALVDDRPVSAGIKFSDADWIGIPFRCVLGKRGLAKGVAEVAVRRGAAWTKEEVALQSLAAFLAKAAGLDDVVM